MNLDLGHSQTLTYRYLCAAALTLTLLPFLTGCGPQASSYTPTTDTIVATSPISIDAAAKSIEVQGSPASVQSQVIDECVIGFDQLNLPYEVKSTDELLLNNQSLSYLRPLATPESIPSVDERLFAVWKVPKRMVGQVAYSIEVEIKANEIIYRNTCSR
ncbi:MAG: hypothetical protein H7249_06600 [Chitinophagaceae bacterium]|nr:hypothetical protein [Oligoflexus sp.]